MGKNARPLSEVATQELSMLPTPIAMDGVMGVRTPEQIKANRKNTIGGAPKALRETVVNELALLKTPTAQLADNGGSQHPDKRIAGGHGPTLADQVEHLLPTPRIAGEGEKNWTGTRSSGTKQALHLDVAVTQLLPTPCKSDGDGGKTSRSGNRKDELLIGGIVRDLLPTPNTLDDMPPKTREQIENHRKKGLGGDRNLREAVIHELPPENSPTRIEWGRYAAAMERLEATMGRPSPPPTEPGKNGVPRLNPAFAEFIMMLPAGWVTDVGISRKAQLRAIGNGVCPPQCVLALKLLLGKDCQ